VLRPSRIKAEPLFAYSYAAKRLFEFAKREGHQRILGQIDPGPAEERLVATLHRESLEAPDRWQPAPSLYWDRWRRECELADQILVNSNWSKQALLEEGLAKEKIRVMPLAFEPPANAASHQKQYPRFFSKSRPLRILFLGQANLRKGMGVLLKVMQQMANAPVEFWIVGPVTVSVPSALRCQPNIRWEGSVARSQSQEYYRKADVFIFPTFSDGFGLTQLEAQAWKIPVIASRFCGEVVTDNVNGILLNIVTKDTVHAAIEKCLEYPEELAAMSARSTIPFEFTVASLSSRLLGIPTSADA
jgi:glycosyltransferase involved in cell wall biosynthesis